MVKKIVAKQQPKKIRKFHLVALFVLAASSLVAIRPAYVSAFAGGNGTVGTPWQVANCTDLQEMDDDAAYNNDYFVLTSDIDCTDVEFEPLTWPDLENPGFRGQLDGANYEISNVTISEEGSAGLFSELSSGAAVKNLWLGGFQVASGEVAGILTPNIVGDSENRVTIDNVHIGGSSVSAEAESGAQVGGLSGTAQHVTVHNVTTVGVTVSGREYVGGLIGQVYHGAQLDDIATGGTITATGGAAGGLVGYLHADDEADAVYQNLSSSATISAGSGQVGGLFGSLDSTSLVDVHATGNVTGSEASSVGGLVGRLDGAGLMNRAYATGTITVTGESDSIGGLVGSVWGTYAIQQSFATGDVTVPGGYNVGGLIGRVAGWDGVVVRDSYARGDVTGNETVAGFAGLNTGSLERVYATGAVVAVVDGDTEGGVGGLVAWDGEGDGTVSDSFWDTTTSGQVSSLGGTGKATSAMKNVATYTDLDTAGLDSAWDFVGNPNDDNANANIWLFSDGFNDDYPCLAWYASCTPAPAPEDNDGISTEVENAAPNSGDGNNDGTPDAEQANVASFVNTVTGKYVTVAVPVACSLSALSSYDVKDNAAQDKDYVYQNGMTGFTASCGENGFAANIKVYYYGASIDNLVLRKYNPNSQKYFTIDGAVLSSQTIGGEQAVLAEYAVVDGGTLDVDGVENGVIVDPVGPAVTVGGVLANTGVNVVALLRAALVIVTLGMLVLLVGKQPVKARK